MNKPTGNNENNEVSAEALYRRYQKSRLSSPDYLQHDLDATRPVNDTLDAPGISDKLYRRYQNDRASKAETSIDAIMQAIDEQSIENHLQQNEQPIISAGVPDIQSIPVKQVQIDADLQVNDSVANNPTGYRRLILPAIAAAIVGILLIPLLLMTPSETDTLQITLPTALADQATQAVAFIDPPAGEAFGFSDTTDTAKMAFNNGVSVTDLHLLVEADQSALAGPLLRVLITQTDIRTATEQFSSAIVDGVSDEVIRTRLNDLTVEVEQASRNSNQLDWYLMGRSVESLRIAAEYALEYSDIEILEQALSLASNLARPTDIQGVGGLLDVLLQSRITSPDEFAQVSEILTTANDIKVLMR